MFVITLTNDIMAATADVEGALEAAAAAQCSVWPSRKPRQDARYMQLLMCQIWHCTVLSCRWIVKPCSVLVLEVHKCSNECSAARCAAHLLCRAAQAAEESSRHDVEAPSTPAGASATNSSHSEQASPARLHRGADDGHQSDDADGLSSVPGSPTSGRLRSVYSIEARESSSSTTAGANAGSGAAPALVRPFQRLSFETGGLKPRRKVAPADTGQDGNQLAAGSDSSAGNNSSGASGKGAAQEQAPKQQPSKARQYLKNEVAWLWLLMEQVMLEQL